jgi:methylated-DNA-[protein]-cysteine S-methyltransferase
VQQNFVSHLNTGQHLFKIETNEEAVKAISFIEFGVFPPESGCFPPIMAAAKAQLQAFMEGSLTAFSLLLAPDGTPFQQQVWNVLLQIPYGKTFSYAEMAHKLGDPKVIRAAAAANGKNPIAVVIPCHRVIGTNGSLTGYAGGLSNKRFLLDLENQVANGVLGLFSTTL